jgi:hypothetical protein
MVLSLTVLSLIGQLAVHFAPDFVVRDRFARTFNVDEEGNIPALYSTLTILGCAVLLRVIARIEREAGGRWSRQWTLMSIIFLGLAADEFLASTTKSILASISRVSPSGHGSPLGSSSSLPLQSSSSG